MLYFFIQCGFKSHRPRSGALVRRVHGQAGSRSAGAYIDVPKFGHHQFTTWDGRSFHEEDSRIGDLVCSISFPQKRAKEDPQSEGAAVQLLKKILIQSSPNEHTGRVEGLIKNTLDELILFREIIALHV